MLFLWVSPSRADDPVCSALKDAWAKVRTYRCSYRALTSHEGKVKETRMVYAFAKPGKVRMDISLPSRGAVLLYDPEDSPKVRVRPFPSLPFFILKYGLDHPRVSTDSGGTVDRSDLGSRMESLCGTWEGIKSGRLRGRLISGRYDPDRGGEVRWTLAEGSSEDEFRAGIGESGFLERIERMGPDGKAVESYEWTDLEINPAFGPDAFKKFQP
ncbi:MAG: hypothetical protein A2902_05785 [Elusimicrobia bacterium RIFCSPLOWO2_01_FULL_64_13]|nr:MAG: hypothetical protein A2902_05785 [Elusimicrobia bacterium RIFCSPLOWO2_01_FULL_64_13]